MSNPSPLPSPLRPAGPLLSRVYAGAVGWRNRRFDKTAPSKLRVPVISVGNLTVGGTGKTPVVAWFARRLLDIGRHPVIGMRGYKARNDQLGDEQLEHEARNPDVPVVANPDRYRAISAFLEQNPQYDTVILDDGFQHRRLARDLDLLLIDATRSPFQDRVLPAGWLREPVTNLTRADAILITRMELVDPNAAGTLNQALARATKAPVMPVPLLWSELRIHDRREPLDWLKERRCVALSGIGNPDAFHTMARSRGAILEDSIVLPDHAHYDGSTLRNLLARVRASSADAVLTTEKDWVKLRPLLPAEGIEVEIVRPHIDMVPSPAAHEEIDTLLARALATPNRQLT